MVTVCMEMLEYDEDYDMELVGDFTTLTLLEVCQQKGGNFADRAKAIQQRLTEDLEHSTYSAVEFERELKKRTGDMQGVIMPVSSCRRERFGISKMDFEKRKNQLCMCRTSRKGNQKKRKIY